ncbi:MAG: mevalonate kinase [Verrucomicrobia bacterium]|nr:mevalonate kinase [Kiritimatiellia bacterium]MCO6400783.1 mevalonate kinase [Verrucomicrobiota bacterium]
MIAIAPGKLILSGEHAVVYGRPALAMAIDRCAQSIITPGQPDLVSFNLLDLKECDSFTLRALGEMRVRLARNYQLFLNGELGIRDVLHKPIELFEFAFITLLDGLHLKFGDGLDIQTQSNIPIGCGMGSSAATVLSMLRAIGHYFRVEFRPDWFLKYSMEAEKLQHGFPSGVDSYISLHGGCALFREGQALSVPLPRLNLYLVNTGTPAATTGECVVSVKQNFGSDPIWNDFEAITLELEKALRSNDRETFQRMVVENQRLLARIGVVPEKVNAFVRAIEERGGAAKVCGAGSVIGDNGGMVLVISEQAPTDLCKEYGYELITVRGDPLGARIV